MAHRHIYSPAIRGPIRVLRSPCPSGEAGNEGNSPENDVFDRYLTRHTTGNDH